MNYLDDTHMAQIDAAATRRAQDEDWRDTKPTKHIDRVRASLAEYLALPESFPIVQGDMMNTLIRRAFAAKERRFTGEAITGFDQLQEQTK